MPADFNIVQSKIPGVHVIQPLLKADERGYLARVFCHEQFGGLGLNTEWVQTSLTHTRAQFTLRGMHYQSGEGSEIKLIRCVAGCVWDCVLDVRPDSPTYGQWDAWSLSASNEVGLYVPTGIAHGFLTMTPDARMLYSMSHAYKPAAATGIRWDDPKAGIQWPSEPLHISEKDMNLPLLP